MARHYCNICRLWDDEEHPIYHCPFCNLCRIGKGLGVDACHCMRCNACMHLSEYDRHKCRDLSTCPVCTEYLFDSKQPYRVSLWSLELDLLVRKSGRHCHHAKSSRLIQCWHPWY